MNDSLHVFVMPQRLKRIKENVSLYGLIVKKKFEQFLDDSKKTEKLPTICQLCQQNANVTLFSFVQVYMNQFYLSGMSQRHLDNKAFQRLCDVITSSSFNRARARSS